MTDVEVLIASPPRYPDRFLLTCPTQAYNTEKLQIDLLTLGMHHDVWHRRDSTPHYGDWHSASIERGSWAVVGTVPGDIALSAGPVSAQKMATILTRWPMLRTGCRVPSLQTSAPLVE